MPVIISIAKRLSALRAEVASWHRRFVDEFASDTGALQTDSGDGAGRKTSLARLSALTTSFAAHNRDGRVLQSARDLAQMGSPTTGCDTGQDG